MEKSPKIIFWGTSDFAVPALEALINNQYELTAVITNPDKPVGRKQILTPSPVKIVAEKHRIKVLQPDSLKTYHLPTITYHSDLFIVASYGKIIPKKILDIPKYGTLNIHPSLLPRWRGPSPIQHTILNGDKETAVTIMQIDEEMDHGPIIATSEKLQITSKTTYKDLHDELAQIGAKLLIDILPKYLNNELKPKPQDHSQATYSHMLSKDSGHLDWSKSAEETDRTIRALNPWPGTWTTIDLGKGVKKLSIEKAESVSQNNASKQIGLVWQNESNDLYVQTGKGSLKVLELTMEGKKPTKAADFLRGNNDILGKILK